MNTSEVAFLCLSVLAGGGALGAGIALRSVLTSMAFKGYEITIRLGPAPKPDAATAQAVPVPVASAKQSKYANDAWQRRQRDMANGRFLPATQLREASSS